MLSIVSASLIGTPTSIQSGVGVEMALVGIPYAASHSLTVLTLSAEGLCKTLRRPGEPLSIVWTLQVRNVHQFGLDVTDVVLLESNSHYDHGPGTGRICGCPARGNCSFLEEGC